ncbi:hypothetical protein GPECTOR_35g932 [Gonium pectorale]|uniref:Uncharacterized protein n=1 Tax=Gonium pectorale TaxID=33097 RepID=A0A150GCC5_GONPE|nr:hypothetical protein GPECTOR_35g932 [Gonium pectorale]|eukprot:KXZ47494.1 hypothetical protein GPECTOR_35g932 [Gonium pectorale]
MLLNAARRLAVSAFNGQGSSPSRAAQAAGRLLQGGGSSRGVSTGCATGIGSHMSDNDPKSLAHHKEKALKGETPDFVEGAEGWHETLASVSEAVVKAEQLVDDDTTQVPEKLEHLQRHTISVVQQLHHVGEEGASPAPKRAEQDVSGSPAHSANLEHMRTSPGDDPR